MNEFSNGCRVKCVDATPLPIHVPGALATDFSFPGGFVEEGKIYSVEGVFTDVAGQPCLMLEGMPVLHRGREIPWCGVRFRRVSESVETRAQEEVVDLNHHTVTPT